MAYAFRLDPFRLDAFRLDAFRLDANFEGIRARIGRYAKMRSMK